MIIHMVRVRIMGPRADLASVIESLRDVGTLHVAEVEESRHGLTPFDPGPEARHVGTLQRAASNLADAIAALRIPLSRTQVAPASGRPVEWVRLARRMSARLSHLAERESALREEQAALERYAHFFDAFGSALERAGDLSRTHTSHLILRPGSEPVVQRLRDLLERELEDRFEIYEREIPGGEVAVLLVLPAGAGSRVERLLSEAGVQELGVPDDYGSESLAGAMPGMLRRLEQIPSELDKVEYQRRRLAEEEGEQAVAALTALRELLEQLEAERMIAQTRHAFVLEGWTPESELERLRNRLLDDFEGRVVVEELSLEEWEGQEAPVVLSNPRLFRPFEAITRMLPLPRYGSLDPTPFVGVFFPLFFGVILGDIAYGLALAVLAVALRRHSEHGTTLRSVSEIAGACAAFTVIFGLLYGELLGDLGHRWFGLEPLAFDRQEAIMPALFLAVGLGVVHVVLGLTLSFVTSFGQGRRAVMGKGLTVIATLLVVVAILAAVRVLPHGLLMPAVVAIVIVFPVLVILEGVVAPIEFLSTMGNILSYARIMALGTASVMLAVVANDMIGAFGAPLIGALFALVFHLLNLGIGIFSPTIHALRLHYVEFFGKFYSPGGVPYRPLKHWRPDSGSGTAAH